MEIEFKIRCSQIGKIMGKSKKEGELSETCKTYLREWYANDFEPIHSKYIDKGNQVEDELIDFMAIQLGYGVAEKNKLSCSDEFIQGECDVILYDCIVDVKASWNRKTLNEQAVDGLDSDYEWQLIGYCHLYSKPKGILFYGLMNTPETNYTAEVIYDNIPANKRWIAYEVTPSKVKIDAIIERVKQCRVYLENYERLLNEKLGKIN